MYYSNILRSVTTVMLWSAVCWYKPRFMPFSEMTWLIHTMEWMGKFWLSKLNNVKPRGTCVRNESLKNGGGGDSKVTRLCTEIMSHFFLRFYHINKSSVSGVQCKILNSFWLSLPSYISKYNSTPSIIRHQPAEAHFYIVSIKRK